MLTDTWKDVTAVMTNVSLALEQADLDKEAARRALSEFENKHRDILAERDRLHDVYRNACTAQLDAINAWWVEKRAMKP